MLNRRVPTQSVYVPRVGFRSASGLRMPEMTIARQGERALAVVQLVSSEIGTEVCFEIQDDVLQDACLGGKFDHLALTQLDVKLRDEAGREYKRLDGLRSSIGLGQQEFAFFRRELGFETLAIDARRVVLEVDGAFGPWRVPVEMRPTAETGVAVEHVVDRATTRHGVTVRLVGIALREEEAVVELHATCSPPIVSVRAIGALMQRQGNDRLVLVDGQGRRFEEELARETTQQHSDSGARAIAKFPPLPADATDLRLVVPSVVVEESSATLEFELPMKGQRDVRFGAYPMRLGPATVAHDLPEAPGRQPGYGLRFALGPRGWHNDRRVVRPMRISIDGVERKGFGWGWHPEPDMTNYTVTLTPGESPKTVTLERPMLSVRGPWEIRFRRPV